jgi:nucleotidyltransferase substrate binding protein (TIGR01987 family)
VEKLSSKQEKFLKSLNALERSLVIFSRIDTAPDLKHSLIASSIKHFEMCHEAAWKFLQAYLISYHNQQVDSPKKVFRECFAQGILDAITSKNLLDMTEARNSTVHDYDEESAQEACKRIVDYYQTLKLLEKLISNHQF